MSEQAQQTLYERLGGEEGLSKLLVAFYDRVLQDEALSGFFIDVPIEKLQHMQHEFFAAALDGPVDYSGRPLSEVHAGMGITPHHLRLFLDHLLETLEGYEIGEDDRYDIVSRINLFADEITGRTSVDG